MKVVNTLPNLIQRVERKTGVLGFMEVLYLCFSQWIACQPRLQATFRRKPCPEYSAASRLFRKFCGVHYVRRHDMPLNHGNQYSDLTDVQYSAIGRVVVEWSNVEYLLSVVLSRLLRTPEYLGRTYTTGLAAVRIQTAISDAVEVHRHRYERRLIQEPELAAIESANIRVTTLRAERNKISHFCWCRTNDEAVFGTSFAGGVPTEKWKRKNSKTLKLSELQTLHSEAHALTEELMRIVNAIRATDESVVSQETPDN